MGQSESQLKPEDISELKIVSHYTEEEINKFYDEFHKNYPRGRVKKKDLQKLYKDLFPNGDSSTIAEQFFRVYDVDNNGAVDFREFLCAIGALTRGTENERLRLLFKIYDQDGSGFISHEEYHNVVAALYKAAGRLYGSEDKAEEAEAFNRLDKNNDDLVSYEEFEAFALSDPTVKRLMKVNVQPDRS